MCQAASTCGAFAKAASGLSSSTTGGPAGAGGGGGGPAATVTETVAVFGLDPAAFDAVSLTV